jgi:hypothetical protein
MLATVMSSPAVGNRGVVPPQKEFTGVFGFSIPEPYLCYSYFGKSKCFRIFDFLLSE